MEKTIMNMLFINQADVSLPFAKKLGATYDLTVVHDPDCPRGWMFFYVNGEIWGRQYVKVENEQLS